MNIKTRIQDFFVAMGLWVLWIGHSVATLGERLESYPRLKRVFLILFWGTSGAIWLFSIYLAFIVARYGREIMPYNETIGLASICLTATILFITPILILKPARFLSLGVLYSALAAFAYMVSNSIWVFVLALTPGAIYLGWKLRKDWLYKQMQKEQIKDVAEPPPDAPRELPPKISDTLAGKPADIFDGEEEEEQRFREKLKDAQNSPFGRWVSMGSSLSFQPYDEKTVINKLREKGYIITKP